MTPLPFRGIFVVASAILSFLPTHFAYDFPRHTDCHSPPSHRLLVRPHRGVCFGLCNRQKPASHTGNSIFNSQPNRGCPSRSNHECEISRRSSALLAHETEDVFGGLNTVSMVGGQALIAAVAVAVATLLGTPNHGLGPNFALGTDTVGISVLCTIPLALSGVFLNSIRSRFPAIENVSRITQRAVVALLGRTFKPALALGISFVLGISAGLGEEILFRGVMQFELTSRVGFPVSLSVTSLVFGVLHAVTPVYATIAGLASAYLGYLYQASSNLALPILTHTLYDIFAFLLAHWTVTRLTDPEIDNILNFDLPTTPEN